MTVPDVTPATIDRAAVARLGDERLDWRFRSLPDALLGLTAAQAADRRPRLFHDGFVGPIVALHGPAMDHNIATVAAWATDRGLALAPHGKTTMAPALFTRQLDHGAWAITVATAAQARVCRAFGVDRILVANEFIDPAGLTWLSAELDADPGFTFVCWADSVRAVELMTQGWTGARPIDVLVEVGVPGGRTGVRDLAAAEAVAAAITASAALRLVGVGGYEAPAATDASADGLASVADYLRTLRAAALALRPSYETDQVIVTAGGSAYFDLVAEALAGPWPFPALPVLRCGTYITHDDGFYAEVSPLGAHPRVSGPPLRSALLAWAQVVSQPEPGLSLLAVGKRDVPQDLGLPRPRLLRTPDGTRPLTGTITALNDQHAFLRDTTEPRIGDWVGLGLSHPCTTFDRWPLLPVTDEDGETVTEFVRTYF